MMRSNEYPWPEGLYAGAILTLYPHVFTFIGKLFIHFCQTIVGCNNIKKMSAENIEGKGVGAKTF